MTPTARITALKESMQAELADECDENKRLALVIAIQGLFELIHETKTKEIK